MKPTGEHLRILTRAAQLDAHGMTYGTPRRVPSKAVRQCLDAGWLRELPELVVVADGDGYALQPERWRTGYEITDAGRLLVGVCPVCKRAWSGHMRLVGGSWEVSGTGGTYGGAIAVEVFQHGDDACRRPIAEVTP